MDNVLMRTLNGDIKGEVIKLLGTYVTDFDINRLSDQINYT